jgi:hypothetical protein
MWQTRRKLAIHDVGGVGERLGDIFLNEKEFAPEEEHVVIFVVLWEETNVCCHRESWAALVMLNF